MARGPSTRLLGHLARTATLRSPEAATGTASGIPSTSGRAIASSSNGNGIGSSGNKGRLFPSATSSAPGSTPGQFTQTRGNLMGVQATKLEAPITAIPEIQTDLFGAVSPVTDSQVQEGVFKNVDGHRFEDGRYKAFQDEISGFIPKERQYTDPVRTFSYGTDASFYRLNPKMVVKVSAGCLLASNETC